MYAANEILDFFKGVPFLGQFKINVSSVDVGKVTLTLKPTNNLMNHFNQFQAGAVFTVAEIVGGVACATIFPVSEYFVVAQNCKIDFISSSRNELLFISNVSSETDRSVLVRKGLVRTIVNVRDCLNVEVAKAEIIFYVRKISPQMLKRIERKSR